jgi:hypothetical protein
MGMLFCVGKDGNRAAGKMLNRRAAAWRGVAAAQRRRGAATAGGHEKPYVERGVARARARSEAHTRARAQV